MQGDGGGRAGLRSVRDEGTAEKSGVQTGPHNKIHHKTKQKTASKQAKTQKIPRAREVASGTGLAQALGTIPVSSKEKDKEKKTIISVDYHPKGLYRELFIHFNPNMPAINSITQ